MAQINAWKKFTLKQYSVCDHSTTLKNLPFFTVLYLNISYILQSFSYSNKRFHFHKIFSVTGAPLNDI